MCEAAAQLRTPRTDFCKAKSSIWKNKEDNGEELIWYIGKAYRLDEESVIYGEIVIWR